MKPIEMPIGQNYGIIRQIVNRQSVSLSGLAIARKVCKPLRRQWPVIPRALRRGVIKLAIETHRENQAVYGFIMRRGRKETI